MNEKQLLSPAGVKAGFTEEEITFLHQLGYSVIIFASPKKIHLISLKLLSEFRLPNDFTLASNRILRKLPEIFSEQIFRGPHSVYRLGSIRNYRLWMRHGDDQLEYLYNIHAYMMDDGRVATLWQNVEVDKLKDYGFIKPSIQKKAIVNDIIRPYLSSKVMERAYALIESEEADDPFSSETIEVTVLFTDIVGFTQMSEKLPAQDVIEMLNLVFSSMSHSIEKNFGYIDKFMGDAVMAVFEKPFDAVTSGIEILNELASINELRSLMERDPIHVRIGVNSGRVIQGSVGMSRRMDWTVIGDTVNTASRIERAARSGELLIGDNTYRPIKDVLDTSEPQLIRVKGKKNQLLVHSVHGLKYEKNGEMHDLTIYKSPSVLDEAEREFIVKNREVNESL